MNSSLNTQTRFIETNSNPDKTLRAPTTKKKFPHCRDFRRTSQQSRGWGGKCWERDLCLACKTRLFSVLPLDGIKSNIFGPFKRFASILRSSVMNCNYKRVCNIYWITVSHLRIFFFFFSIASKGHILFWWSQQILEFFTPSMWRPYLMM